MKKEHWHKYKNCHGEIAVSCGCKNPLLTVFCFGCRVRITAQEIKRFETWQADFWKEIKTT